MSWRDEKRHPDRNGSEGGDEQTWKVGPGDASFAGDQAENSFDDDDGKVAPDVVADTEHASAKQHMPSDHPGENVGEQLKGLPAGWGKASP